MGGSKTPKTGTNPYEGALSQMALDAYNQTAGIRNYFLGSPAGGGAGTISIPAGGNLNQWTSKNNTFSPVGGAPAGGDQEEWVWRVGDQEEWVCWKLAV